MKSQASLRDRQIVAFTKDWDDVPTCTTHLMRIMAREWPVLWVCSIGTRKPSLQSGKDWRRLLQRLTGSLKRAEWKENQLKVLRPLLIPKAETPWGCAVNRRVFGTYLKRERPHGFRGTTEYWCFVPNAVDLLPPLLDPHDRVIYYCADDWTQFHNLDGSWMQQKEQRLLERVHQVFVTSRYLEETLRSRMKNNAQTPVTLMTHGVDFARFSKACDKNLALPADIAAVPSPRIGFYGNLHPWVDFKRIAAMATARPQWSFVLIGEPYAKMDSLNGLANVHCLGRRDHAMLPDYCRGFDAAMIPYDMSHVRMQSVNPVKTKELLAAGVPVVASRIPELEGYGDCVLLCDRLDAWLAALEQQIQLSAEQRIAISESVRDEDWDQKVRRIRELIASS